MHLHPPPTPGYDRGFPGHPDDARWRITRRHRTAVFEVRLASVAFHPIHNTRHGDRGGDLAQADPTSFVTATINRLRNG